MASTDEPPSQESNDLDQPAAVGDEEPFLPGTLTKTTSPAPSGSSGLPDLVRSSSTLSSDKVSLRSHVSIPVVGTFPLGSLRVHRAMDSPRPQPAKEPQLKMPGIPPLENRPEPPPSSLNGDVFISLDLPDNCTVGCDAKAINTGTSGFQGFRDFPTGAHFVWISEPNAMYRCGYWFITRDNGQVRVKQWDRFNEVLVQPGSQFEARDHRENIANLYPQLIPYGYDNNSTAVSREPTRPISVPQPGFGDQDEAQTWQRLTSSISEKLLGRVTGKKDVCEWLVDTSDSAKGESNFLPTKQLYKTVVGTGELNFLFPEGDVDLGLLGVSAENGTPDTSLDILRLLDTPGAGVTESDLVGELQFTFLNGLHLTNLSCIDQWWHLVLKIILRAHQLLLLRPGLCRSLIQTLHAQMVYNEKHIASNPAADFEDEGPRHEYGGVDAHSTSILDIVPGNKYKLREALTLYKRRMNETLLNLQNTPDQPITAEQAAVGQAFVDLEAWFGWDLRTDYVEKTKEAGLDVEMLAHGDDDDDYQPVIVDLDENGREVGLVSFN